MNRPHDPPGQLLFGLLALQTGLIDQTQLVAAFQCWTKDRSRPLAKHLVAMGYLAATQQAAIDALAALHVEAHGDATKSLAAVPAGRSTQESLAKLDDPDITATLNHVAAGQCLTVDQGGDADRTPAYTVGTAASDGQRFRVLRPHARGGLGAVFVAIDCELNREVALKQILDHHADDVESRRRFLLEAEVTGGLEHPGIVPVYGLGTYAAGRPYYAMRFIRGDSLKEAIDRFHGEAASRKDPGRRSLELRKLLRRFTDVCNALDYAHSHGVLHRDIKPGNIIVGKHGETLVVDWGLAKATGKSDPGAEERTLRPSSASGSAETLPGSAMGTPAFMSPEQARGDLEALGPQSDVYSLGGTLYCLLTGKAPQEGHDLGEVLRRVQRGEFTPPRQVAPEIDPPLEAVCLKAMARDAEDRYPSCRALADDIERWMADEPVSAWAEPWTRTLMRWLTRHRTGVTGAAAAVLVGVVGLSAVLAVQARANAGLSRSLARERDAKTALAEANDALTGSRAAVQARYALAVEAIKTFHTGVSEDFLLKQPQFKELRDRLLRSGADFYGKLGDLLGRETDLASRRALTASNFELAELTARVGRNEDALAGHQAVLAAREALAEEPGAGVEALIDLGRSQAAVAALLAATGKTDEALAAYRRSEVLLDELTGSGPMARSALAACRTGLGDLLSSTGNVDEAIEAYRKARSDLQDLAMNPAATNDQRRDLAINLFRLAIMLSETGKPEEAEAEWRTAIDIQRKLADENPAVTDFRSGLARSHNSLGILLAEIGRSTEAESEHLTAIEILRKLADENPAVTDFRSGMARSRMNLGVLLWETGRLAEAESENRAAIDILRKLADENPSVTDLRSLLAGSRHNLGLLLSQIGRLDEAESEDRAAIDIQRKLADENPTMTEFRLTLAPSRLSLGLLLSERGRSEEAEVEDRLALAIYRKLAEENPTVISYRVELAGSHSALGILLSNTNRPTEAETEYRMSLASLQKLVDDNPESAQYRNLLAFAHFNLGVTLSRSGKPVEAEANFRLALAIERKLADENPKHPAYRDEVANTLSCLSVVARRLGRLSEAIDHCDRAITLHEALVAEDPKTTDYREGLAADHLNRGLVRLASGETTGAEADLRRALTVDGDQPSHDGERSFLSACARAALAGLTGRDGSGVSSVEASSQANAAMVLLREAAGMGYRNSDAYRTEDALAPLRSRDDFQLLLMDLSFPTAPFMSGVGRLSDSGETGL